MNKKWYSGLTVGVLLLGGAVQPMFAASAKIQISARVVHVEDTNRLLQRNSTVQALRSTQANSQQTHVLSETVVKVNIQPMATGGVRQVILINH